MPNMIATVVPHAGGRLERVERAIPEPGPGELLIEVHACGICHSDALTVEGHLPGIQYPRVPRREVIGSVTAIGASVRGWQLGDSYGYCVRCRRGNAFACEDIQAVIGVTRDCGYAAHLVASASAAGHVLRDLNAAKQA